MGAAHSSCGELRELVDSQGRQSAFPIPTSLVQLGAVFCIHLVFLADEDAHKKTQNSHYVLIVP